MTSTPTPRAFRIDADLLGGTVTLDGIGPVDCLDYELIGGTPDRPTRLLLHLPADGVVEGTGIIETIRDAPTGDMVRRLNVKAVEAAALARSGMGTNHTAKVVEVIAEMLDGAAGR